MTSLNKNMHQHFVGLRVEHYSHLLEHDPGNADGFELISENFFTWGGQPRKVAEKLRKERPISLHGVSMAVGNVDPPSEHYLRDLSALIQALEPVCVSDHLCWGGYGGHHAHDLLPLPLTEEVLNHVAMQVCAIQDALGRHIALENPSSYVAFNGVQMPEAEFLAELSRRSGCKLLLDVNNIYVGSRNFGWDLDAYMEALPIDSVEQFHVSGHTDHGTHVLDSHRCPVPDAVWSVYAKARERFGAKLTVLEWDEDIPAYPELLAENDRGRVWGQTPSIEAEPKGKAGAIDADVGNPHFQLPRLEKVQEAFWRMLRDGPQKPCEASIAPIQELIAGSMPHVRQRLSVYHGMYWARLLGILESDFPRLQAWMGAAAFAQTMAAYLAMHPSGGASVRFLGARVPKFIRQQAGLRPATADVALFEWSRADGIDAVDVPRLCREDLSRLPAENWAGLPLIRVPGTHMLSLEYNVEALWAGVPDSEIRAWAPAEHALITWPWDGRLWHRRLSSLPGVEAILLLADKPEATFGDLCAMHADELGAEDAAQNALQALLTAVDHGLLASKQNAEG